MSEIKTKEKLVGQLSAVTLNATAIVPEWLQPIIKENGVYVGTEEPTDPTKLVWINPDGEASDLDLSNYYTKDETDSLIDTAIQDIDLSSYATKVELENYDTSEQVDAKINAILIPEIDLSDYAKKSDIPDVSGYALKTEIPTKAEQINYDVSTSANYFESPGTLQEAINIIDDSLTSNTRYVNAVIKKLSNYALKTEIPSIEGLASTLYVDNSIANIEIQKGIKHISITDINQLLNLETGYYYIDDGFNYEGSIYYGILIANKEINIFTFIDSLTQFEYSGEEWYRYSFVFYDEYLEASARLDIIENAGYQTEEQVNTLINTALGVIENGTY